MSRDIEGLLIWVKVCLWICAICTTVVPLIYSLSPWYKSPLGRAFMIQAIAFALIIDINLVFVYWRPDSRVDILTRLWVNSALLTFVAGAALAIAVIIWRLNHRRARHVS